jgi:hypothetical protein
MFGSLDLFSRSTLVNHGPSQTPLLAFKSRSFRWLGRHKNPNDWTLGTNQIVALLSDLPDTHDHRFLKKEDLAGPTTELNTSILTQVPLCVAGGNELADVFHHQRFHRIGKDRRCDCNTSCVGTIKAPATLVVG